MLKDVYDKPETLKTVDVYREISERTGVEAKELRQIFAVFYDVIAESIVEDEKDKVNFDRALNFKVERAEEKIAKNADDSITIMPEVMKIKVALGEKLKNTIIDLYDKKTELGN